MREQAGWAPKLWLLRQLLLLLRGWVKQLLSHNCVHPVEQLRDTVRHIRFRTYVLNAHGQWQQLNSHSSSAPASSHSRSIAPASATPPLHSARKVVNASARLVTTNSGLPRCHLS